MKIIATILLTCLVSLSIQAQIKKNQWIIGGRGDFSSAKGGAVLNGIPGGESKTTNYEITVGFGYFFMDKFCGGLRGGGGGLHDKQSFLNPMPPSYYIFSFDSKVRSFVISPFARYYFLKVTERVNVIGEFSYTYLSGTSESKIHEGSQPPGLPPSASESTSKNKLSSNSVAVSGGPAFFINSKASLEFMLKYSHSVGNGSNGSAHTFGMGFGFQIHLGK